MRKIRFVVAFLVAAGLTASSPLAAQADTATCAAKLSSLGTKLSSSTDKALQKGLKTIRSSGNPKGADLLEKNLAKVFNVGGPAGKSQVSKVSAGVAKLFDDFPDSVCTSADLVALGQLESGVNAPGAAPGDFVTTSVVVRAIDSAVTGVLSTMGDAQDLINSAVAVSDCTGASATTANASCTAAGVPAACCTGLAAGTCRPNVCSLRAAVNPDCRVVACELTSGSSGTLFVDGTGSTPLPAGGDDLSFSVCQTPSLEIPIDTNSAYRVLLGGATKTIQTGFALDGGITVCVNDTRSVGWCDCAGAAEPINPTRCQDHIVNDNPGGPDDCGAAEADAALEDCACAVGGGSCTDVACASTACVDSSGDKSPCHAGTLNGPQVTSYGGASLAGDCLLLKTFALKLLPPAVCVDGSSQAVGQCTTVCPGPAACAADVACTSAGGVSCIHPTGSDLKACTGDDFVAPGAPLTVPFTTGTALAQVRDLVTTDGVCFGSPNAGQNCATVEDCPGGSCLGATINDRSQSAVGARLTCADYDAGTLTNFKLVAAFPAIDGRPSNSSSGDTITTLSFTCR